MYGTTTTTLEWAEEETFMQQISDKHRQTAPTKPRTHGHNIKLDGQHIKERLPDYQQVNKN